MGPEGSGTCSELCYQRRDLSLGSSADCSTSISLVSFPDVADDSICLRLPWGEVNWREDREAASMS